MNLQLWNVAGALIPPLLTFLPAIRFPVGHGGHIPVLGQLPGHFRLQQQELLFIHPFHRRQQCLLCFFPVPVPDGVAEPCRDDTGGDGDDPDADEADKRREQSPHRRHGIHVPVSHRGQGAHGPPEGGDHIGELLRLHRVLHRIHDDGGAEHDEKADHHGHDELGPGFLNDPDNDLQGLEIPSQLEYPQQPEQPEQAHHPQEPQVRGDEGQVKGYDGQQVYQGHEGKEVLQPGML